MLAHLKIQKLIFENTKIDFWKSKNWFSKIQKSIFKNTIPSNLLQVGNFNFLWIKLGSKRKTKSLSSNLLQEREGRHEKYAKRRFLWDFNQSFKHKISLTWMYLEAACKSKSPLFLLLGWDQASTISKVQNPKRIPFLAQIPHWSCSKTKCNERELNTPKVSENLVRFTFPVFTVGIGQTPENVFAILVRFGQNLRSSEWVNMNKKWKKKEIYNWSWGSFEKMLQQLILTNWKPYHSLYTTNFNIYIWICNFSGR